MKIATILDRNNHAAAVERHSKHQVTEFAVMGVIARKGILSTLAAVQHEKTQAFIKWPIGQ